jgi:hypothetical protein
MIHWKLSIYLKFELFKKLFVKKLWIVQKKLFLTLNCFSKNVKIVNQCSNGEIVVDGAGLFDIRIGLADVVLDPSK